MKNTAPARTITGKFWQTPTTLLIADCLIAAVGFGARPSLGLFLEPMTNARSWMRETFGTALALQNLFWGLRPPVAGMPGWASALFMLALIVLSMVPLACLLPR